MYYSLEIQTILYVYGIWVTGHLSSEYATGHMGRHLTWINRQEILFNVRLSFMANSVSLRQHSRTNCPGDSHGWREEAGWLIYTLGPTAAKRMSLYWPRVHSISHVNASPESGDRQPPSETRRQSPARWQGNRRRPMDCDGDIEYCPRVVDKPETSEADGESVSRGLDVTLQHSVCCLNTSVESTRYTIQWGITVVQVGWGLGKQFWHWPTSNQWLFVVVVV